MDEVSLCETRKELATLLESSIRSQAAREGRLRILEAGCGRRWPLDLAGIEYTLTGVDIDEEALTFRRLTVKDLDETIVGDLRSVSLPREGYHTIYSAFVLEHVSDAERVLTNFCRWLKPGGLLIIRIPDRDSVFGLVARYTPFWAHVWYYRLVKRYRDAGKPGHGPYPTVYDRVVSRRGVLDFCAGNGLRVREEVGTNFYFGRPGVLTSATKLFIRIVGVLSFGRLAWRYNDLAYVLEKT